ncbi:hypothetical protein KP509_10G074700 [Ceratopteris richardii]|uniref:Uncharacterized protein n=1 Tax=Ceratopteris richardii TaxID=49495 RepID=A0A8T2U0D0_CERRI|nr:hypothetical protein KP509_10G074700 [Ceratopteris richardii]
MADHFEEQRIWKIIDAIKTDRGEFIGINVTTYLKYYEQLTEQYGLPEDNKKDTFIRIAHGFTRERIQLRVVQPNMTWADFKIRLLTEFLHEDYSKNNRATFMRWVGTMKLDQHITKGLTEFDIKFNQMPQADRTALEPDKLRNFLNMLDPSLRRELEPMLEDRATASGLTGNWDNVRAAVHRLAQRQEQNQMQTPRIYERDAPGKIDYDPTSHNPRKDDSEITMLKTSVESLVKHVETLATEIATIKSMQELKLRDQEKPKELEQNPRNQMPARRPFNQARRCLWCDDLEHPHWTCNLFKEAKDKNWVTEVD